MKRIIVSIIFLLIPITFAVKLKPNGLPKIVAKRQNHEDRVESVLCGYRVSGLNFKCNLEYQKINMKAEMETLKSKNVCQTLLEKAKEQCKEGEENNCSSVDKRLRKWCKVRQEEIEIYRLKARKYIADICAKAAAEFKDNCPNHVFRLPGTVGRSMPHVQYRLATSTSKPETEQAADYKSNIQSIIDFIYGENQQNINRQDLVSFVKNILKNNKTLEGPENGHKTPNLSKPPINRTVSNFIFGRSGYRLPEHDIAEFVQETFGNDKHKDAVEADKPKKPIIDKSWENNGEEIKPEIQSIIELIFRGTQYRFPKYSVLSFIRHVLYDDPRNVKPSTKKPVKIRKISPEMENMVDYIFERLKYKIDKYYQDHRKTGKMSVPSIVSYLLGRYKQRIEKHKVRTMLNSLPGKNKNAVNVQNILTDLADEFKSKPTTGLPHKYVIPVLDKIPPAQGENKFDISFIYNVIDELVSQEPVDQAPIGKPPSIVKDKFGRIRINQPKPIQYALPFSASVPEEEDEEEEEEEFQEIVTTKPKKLATQKPKQSKSKRPSKATQIPGDIKLSFDKDLSRTTVNTPDKGLQVTTPKLNDVTIKPEKGSAKPETATPKPEGASAKPETATPKPEGGSAKPETATPKPEGGSAKPETATPKPEGASTKQEATSSKPAGTGANEGATTKKPEGTTANVEIATPKPEGTTSQEGVTTPKPEGVTTATIGTTQEPLKAATP